MTINVQKKWLSALDVSKLGKIPTGYRTILRFMRYHYENGNKAQLFITGSGYGAKYFVREDLVDFLIESYAKMSNK